MIVIAQVRIETPRDVLFFLRIMLRRLWNADTFLLFPKEEWISYLKIRTISVLLNLLTLYVSLLWVLLAVFGKTTYIANFQYPIIFGLFSSIVLAKFIRHDGAALRILLVYAVVIDLFCITNALSLGPQLFTLTSGDLILYSVPIVIMNGFVFRPLLALFFNVAVFASFAVGGWALFQAHQLGTVPLPILLRVFGVLGIYLWFSIALCFAVRVYIRNRVELVEVHHLVAELERNMLLNEENTRIRSDLLRTQRVQMVEALTSTMAHEVNQPISCANNYVQAARRWLSRAEPDVPEAVAALQGAEAEIVRVSERVGTVRRLMQRLSSEFTTIDVAALAGRVSDMVKADLTRRGVMLTVERDPDFVAPLILGCEEELMQVLLNLINNAVDAVKDRPGERAVRIALREGDFDEVEIVVADNGQGIAPDELSKVFDRLYTTKNGGSGLGLALCERIVTDHGGTIGISSEPGRGSQVEVRLPCASLSGTSWGS